MATLSLVFVADGEFGEAARSVLESGLFALSREDALALEVVLLAPAEISNSPVARDFDRVLSLDPALSPGAARNAALAACSAELVAVVEPGERIAPGALARHAAALAESDQHVASYGRTAVGGEDGEVVLLPRRGQGGRILSELQRDPDLIASSAALVWRRAALAEPFPLDETEPAALRLGLALRLARLEGEVVFHPGVVAERSARDVSA